MIPAFILCVCLILLDQLHNRRVGAWLDTCLYQGRETPWWRCKNDCLIDVWNLSHLVFYALLAYVYPDCVFILFLVGLLWEYLESWIGVCDWTDVFWNAAGIGIGLLCHSLI